MTSLSKSLIQLNNACVKWWTGPGCRLEAVLMQNSKVTEKWVALAVLGAIRLAQRLFRCSGVREEK